MERAKKARTPIRIALTRTINDVHAELAKDAPSTDFLNLKWTKLLELEQAILPLDKIVLDTMLDDAAVDDGVYNTEHALVEDYVDKLRQVMYNIDKVLHPDVPVVIPGPPPPPVVVVDPLVDIGVAAGRVRSFKLPKIELRKFSGDLKEWLGWWAQFRKIDEDDELHPTDKFAYLIQATVDGTRPRRIVEGYPQTSENYPKAVEALKERFGDSTLLTELYVRQLSSLVILNASKSGKAHTLMHLYDELDSSLRALESLGVTTDQSAAFLYPLVESSLPEEIIKIWQRSPLSGYEDEDDDQKKTVDERLQSLMRFLKREVKGAERLTFVNAGFDSPERMKRHRQPRTPTNDCPTAAGLITMETSRCVFCDKTHESRDCGKAQGMSLEEKRNRVIQKRCCYACLKPGHAVKKCRSFVRCIVCSKKHYAILCPELSQQKSTTSIEKKSPEFPPSTSMSVCSGGGTILPTLRIKVEGERGSKIVRALVDTGAQRSYIKSSVAEVIRATCTGQQPLQHSVFGGGVTASKVHNLHSVGVSSLDLKTKMEISLLSQDKICSSIPRITKGQWLLELSNKGICIEDLDADDGEIEVLFGSDVIGRLMTGESRRINPHLVALKTSFGWTLLGKDGNEELLSYANMLIVNCMDLNDVEKLWKLDVLGITDPITRKTTEEKDEAARNHFEETVSRDKDGRYEVALPWCQGEQEIPSNRAIASSRLKNATAKLNQGSKYDVYNEIFLSWLSEGLIEEVQNDDGAGHYLPHRPVFKPQSMTTPVRPVFDASCRGKHAPSLNELLEKGPNTLELIPSIIHRFRRHRIGAIADIRKAFQMISVRPEDRNFLKFLWWDKWGRMITYRHTRVVFGVSSSPFLLAAVINHHLGQATDEFKDTVEILQKSLYVDNVCHSFPTQEEYQFFQMQSVALLSEAKMELRQWERTIGEEPGVGRLSGNLCGLGTSSSSFQDPGVSSNVLGMTWNRKEDTISCAVPETTLSGVITKRVILSFLARVFDPLGYLSPSLLPPKLLLQQSWALKLGWDSAVPDELIKAFEDWKSQLTLIPEIKIPRCAVGIDGEYDSAELHTFCDASLQAYAAAVFLRTSKDGVINVQLMHSKARVSPAKCATIPRLELLGCLIGARLGTAVFKEMELADTKQYFWTDSTTALAWIQRNSDWGTFVGNRTKEIVKLTNSDDWRHIPGEVNPADLPSRGCSFKELVKRRWWEGPEWLHHPCCEWPVVLVEADEDIITKEMKKTTIAATTTTSFELWYVSKFSNYRSNLRVFCWLRRFVDKCRKKNQECGDLSVEELTTGELQLFKLVQSQTIQTSGKKEFGGLKTTRLDDGSLRVVTRLLYTADQEWFRYPVVLPHSHPIVEQYIRHIHLQHGHAGVQFLMAKLREKVWIVGGRRALKSILSKCLRCRRYSSKPIEVEQAPLPLDRVNTGAAFQVTGIDLAGPLYLKNGKKVWVVIFTCAVYRGVHFELVEGLTTDAFLFSLQKFICRRGRPETIWSDNGTNLRGSSETFKKLDWKRIMRETSLQPIKWKFIPPTAAWWGGWWERLIGTMKDLLRKMLGHSKLSFAQLESMLLEAEATMNGRPLTYVSEDSEDLIPLTPNAFLHDLRNTQMPEIEAVDVNTLRRTNIDLKKMRSELRQRFRKEYLGLLVHKKKTVPQRKLKVGDVVLVGADGKKRLTWPMGKVIELIKGADNHVRVARVKVKEGLFLRPLQRLYPLEVSTEDMPIATAPAEKTEESVDSESVKIITRAGRKSVKPLRYGF